MEAVTNHQSGSMRVSRLVVAAAASAMIAGVIGLSAFTGMLPGKRMPARDEGTVPKVEFKPGQPGSCTVCGTVESIRRVEVPDEAGGSPGATLARSAFRVTVRMDDGSFRAISQSSPPAFAVGDKVRVVEGRLVRA
jgi:hypothetical protein